MKKIINGRLYNTESAKKVGYYNNGRIYNDFSFFEETLYRKRTGEFFLHGEGNATSKYGKYYGDCLGSSEEIIPYTEEKARKWMETHADAEDYIKLFGEPEE